MDFTMLRKVDDRRSGRPAFVDRLVTRDVSDLGLAHRVRPLATSAANAARLHDDDGAAGCVSGSAGRMTRLVLHRTPLPAPASTVREGHRRDYPHLRLQGPRSREILQSSDVDDLSNSSFRLPFREDVEIGGIRAFMTRPGTRRSWYELWVVGDRASTSGTRCWRRARGSGWPSSAWWRSTCPASRGLHHRRRRLDRRCRLTSRPRLVVDLHKADFHGREGSPAIATRRGSA